MMSRTAKKTITPDEAAAILLVSRRTIFRMLKDGRLDNVIGRRPARVSTEQVIKLKEK